jgi:hypothetical protein
MLFTFNIDTTAFDKYEKTCYYMETSLLQLLHMGLLPNEQHLAYWFDSKPYNVMYYLS